MKTQTIKFPRKRNFDNLPAGCLSRNGGPARCDPPSLIFPGGGYRFCSDREAEPIAMAFLAEGYQAFVLRYSLNDQAAFPRPLNDAEEALELIRSKSRQWHVDPARIAVCGFSAGGHLAAALGTMGTSSPGRNAPGISLHPEIDVEHPSLARAVVGKTGGRENTAGLYLYDQYRRGRSRRKLARIRLGVEPGWHPF